MLKILTGPGRSRAPHHPLAKRSRSAFVLAMVKRSTPQRKVDDSAFPIRVRFFVPPRGFGTLMDPLHHWLTENVGRTDYAIHSGGGTAGRDCIAIYFRTPAPASDLMAAFPMIELADGTSSPGYTSPHLPVGRPPEEDFPVCNLYNQTTAPAAMRQLFAGQRFENRAGNLEPGDIYPDRPAPIVRHGAEGLELVRARWGMPSPQSILKTARDPGVTNVRNTASTHWRRWLGPAHRCLVPFDRFAEPGVDGNRWFALTDDRPAFFAGIECRDWTSVRKVKDGPTRDDLFAFLTCAPNKEVSEVHPKAMPVILTEPAEWDAWLSAPWEIAVRLQRPLPDGALRPELSGI